MPGLVPGIYVLGACGKGMDGRDKPGHDVEAPRLNLPSRPRNKCRIDTALNSL
jgi:hypothetical protein